MVPAFVACRIGLDERNRVSEWRWRRRFVWALWRGAALMAAKTDWIHRFGVPSGKRQGRTFVFGVGVALAPAIGGIGVGVLPFWVERDAVELWEAAFPGGSAIAFLVGAGAKVLFSRGSAGGGRLYGTLAVVITGGGMALILFALGSGVGVLAGGGRRALTLGAGGAGGCGP